CHRLNKPCPSQTPAPPRRRKEPKTTRVAELERRLEDLTSRIENAQKQQAQVPTPPDSTDSAANVGPPVPVSPSQLEEIKRQPQYHHRLGYTFPAVFPAAPAPVPGVAGDDPEAIRQRTHGWNIANNMFASSASTPATGATPRPGLVPLVEETTIWPTDDADSLFASYIRMQHLFPFIVLPENVTSEQVRQQRPFLWKAIMMAACHMDGSRQIALGNQLLRDIMEAAFLKPHKSIDLLHGLQILISWFHYNLNSFQMTNLLYMARSICMSLGLNEKGQGVKQSENPADYSSQALEHMRAFAGTYYLVTVIFTTNKKPDCLMNTAYLDFCCRILEARMECPNDDLLVWLVRVQQLAQSISLTLAFRANPSVPQTLPMNLIMKSLQQQLEAFKQSVPAHMRTNPSLIGHQYVAEVLLYEIGLQETTGLPVTDRLEFLWACVTAAKSFFKNKFAEPFTDEPRFICMCSFDFIYTFLTVLKLVTLTIPGWDLRIVRQELRFDDLVDKQIEDMEFMANRRLKPSSARAVADGQLPDGVSQDPFRKLAEKLKLLRDVLCGQEDMGFNDNLAKAATAGAMTVTDATQGIVEDLEGSLWQSLMGAAADWESFDNIPFHGFVFYGNEG
ncbi:hypothetical protein GE09DRAFT_957073, partial [Coniochaeta sp. 2T2.1]